jgi:hypothetical protein
LLDIHYGIILGNKEYRKPSHLLREAKIAMERNKNLNTLPASKEECLELIAN